MFTILVEGLWQELRNWKWKAQKPLIFGIMKFLSAAYDPFLLILYAHKYWKRNDAFSLYDHWGHALVQNPNHRVSWRSQFDRLYLHHYMYINDRQKAVIWHASFKWPCVSVELIYNITIQMYRLDVLNQMKCNFAYLSRDARGNSKIRKIWVLVSTFYFK